jgi:putative hydrolase of the HAD superfamily
VDHSRPPTAVVFDIGGVLGDPEGGVAALAVEAGFDVTSFVAAYWRHRDAYDLGADAEEYWTKVGSDAGRRLTPAEVQWLNRRDARRWAGLAPGVAELLARVAEAGVGMALLSNAPRSLADEVHGAEWGELFPVKIFSCEVGVAKPRSEAYAAVEDALGLPGEELIFFDDRPVNVAAARERSWSAHEWHGPGRCMADLAAAGVGIRPV